MLNFELAKEICKIPGAPGFENNIAKFIISQIKDYVDEAYFDNIGNLITLKKGKSSDKKVMSCAHMDEISFMVKHVDKNGFILFNPLGGFDPKTLTAQKVIVHGRKDIVGVMPAKPIHTMSAEERNKVPKIKDYFVDVGMSPLEVSNLVEVGDPITRIGDLFQMGNSWCGKSLDNRISVYILIEAIKKLKDIPFDFYGVFTVQEEVGCRGAQVATQQINPDFAINLDTTIACDVPGSSPKDYVTALGKGVAIKVYDSRVICNPKMVTMLKNLATENKINYQLELLTAGGTDTSAMQLFSENGSIAGALSIPTRHIHQSVESVDKKDVSATIELLILAITKHKDLSPKNNF